MNYLTIIIITHLQYFELAKIMCLIHGNSKRIKKGFGLFFQTISEPLCCNLQTHSKMPLNHTVPARRI